MRDIVNIEFDFGEKFLYKNLSNTIKLNQEEWDLYYLLSRLRNEEGEFHFNPNDYKKPLSDLNSFGFDDGTITIFDPFTKETRKLEIISILSNNEGVINTRKEIITEIWIDPKLQRLEYSIHVQYSANEITALKLTVFSFEDFRFLIGYLRHDVEGNIESTYNLFNKLLDKSKNNKIYLVYLYYEAPDFALTRRSFENTSQVIEDLVVILTGSVKEILSKAEGAVINILKSFKPEKKESTEERLESKSFYLPSIEFLEALITREVEKKLILWELYSKMNDFGGTDNFTKAMILLRDIWNFSTYSDPNNTMYNDYDAPDYIPYQNKKLLIFNESNFKFEINGREIHTTQIIDEEVSVSSLPSYGAGHLGSKNANRQPATVKKEREITYGNYHSLQPVNLLGLDREGELEITNEPIPVFFIKALIDKRHWSNIENTTWLAIDILTTATGVGNFLKLRHLSKVKGFYNHAKVIIGGIEFFSGVGGVMLTLLENSKNNEFCNKLRKYLLYIDILTLGVDGVITYAKLVRDARKAAKEALEAMDEQLFEEAVNVRTHLLKAANQNLEEAIRSQRLNFRGWSINIKKIELKLNENRGKFNQRTDEGIRNIIKEWKNIYNNKIKRKEFDKNLAKEFGLIFAHVSKKYNNRGKNIARGELKLYYMDKQVFPETESGLYWANAGIDNYIPEELGGVGATLETNIDHAAWLDPSIADKSRFFDAEAKILSKMDEDIAKIADKLGVDFAVLKIEINIHSAIEPCDVCKREILSRVKMYEAKVNLHVPYFVNENGRKEIVSSSNHFNKKYLKQIK